MKDSNKIEVQQQFSKNAEKYVTSSRHAKGKDLKLLIDSSKANKDMSVLDIATGGGHVANAFAPIVKHVTAYDLTEKMLLNAKKFISQKGYTNVEYIQGDAENLPFREKAFDLVACRIAAHHFSNIDSFLSESARVLKSNGKFQLIDNVSPEYDEFDLFFNEIEKLRDPSHARALKKSEWINKIEKQGLRIINFYNYPKPYYFMDWCRRAGLEKERIDSLETKLINAPLEIKNFFNIEIKNNETVSKFYGEAIFIEAVK